MNHLSYPAPPRARYVESSRLVLVVVHTIPDPVHSLSVSGVLSITMNVDQNLIHTHTFIHSCIHIDIFICLYIQFYISIRKLNY